MRKTITAAAPVVLLGAIVIAAANVQGWRARVMARLFRIDNDPLSQRRHLDFDREFRPDFAPRSSPAVSRRRVGWRSLRTEICSSLNQARIGCFVSDSQLMKRRLRPRMSLPLA